MKPGLRGRMGLMAVAVSSAALLLVLALMGPALRRRALAYTSDTLLAEARLMSHVVSEPLGRGLPPGRLDALVDQSARDVHARVTIVAPDGRVLADSAASGAELQALENHGARPEVQEALRGGRGIAIRHSATVKQDLLYAAVAVRHDGKVVGVSRVALSLAGVDEQVAELRQAVGAALALAFVLSLVLSALLAAPLAGPLRDIMAAARQLSAGNLQTRIEAQRTDELGELARILDGTAKELQERLAENSRDRARTETLLAAMEDGVLATDHRGHVLVANEALRRSLELQAGVGRHYLEALRQREIGDLIEAVLKSGERRSLEVELRHRRRTYAIVGVPFPGAENAPHGAVLTFHDITERRRLDQVRRDFVANASHELRTPLTSIRGFVEALEDGARDEPQTATRFLSKIRVHADRMAALVEDLLELSRLESGERPPRLQPVLPAELVSEVVSSFTDLASRKGVRLGRADQGAGEVVTDEERLRRILDNLVDNAVKYTPSGGSVEVVSAPAAGGGVEICVRDDGPGIAAEHLPRLFERFYRVDRARSRELGGTGLGLAIVKHLAEGMGGSVSVASEVGRGTAFTLRLPGS